MTITVLLNELTAATSSCGVSCFKICWISLKGNVLLLLPMWELLQHHDCFLHYSSGQTPVYKCFTLNGLSSVSAVHRRRQTCGVAASERSVSLWRWHALMWSWKTRIVKFNKGQRGSWKCVLDHCDWRRFDLSLHHNKTLKLCRTDGVQTSVS